MWDQIRDLLAELADVIITAAVAISGVTGGDVEEAPHHPNSAWNAPNSSASTTPPWTLHDLVPSTFACRFCAQNL